MKHTKGPWSIKTERYMKVGRQKYYEKISIVDVENSEIASWPEFQIDLMANARLIAAAPELLKALKEVFEMLEEEMPNCYLKKHYNLISAAINKAEGR